VPETFRTPVFDNDNSIQTDQEKDD